MTFAKRLLVALSLTAAWIPAAVAQGDGCLDYENCLHWLGALDTPGWVLDVAVVGDHAYVADGMSGLQVVDVSTPGRPVVVGEVDTPGFAAAVVVARDHAYLADGASGLQVIDISTPTAPVIVGTADTPGFAARLTLMDRYAYVADGAGGLQVIDVSEPTAPAVRTELAMPDNLLDIMVDGRYGYAACGAAGLLVLDVSELAAPVCVGSVGMPGDCAEIVVAGDWAYVAGGASGLQVVDLRTPEHPEIVATADVGGIASNIAVSGGFAYLTGFEIGVQVVDVSLPKAPQPAGSLELPGMLSCVTVAGNVLYTSGHDLSLQVIDVAGSASAPLLAQVEMHGSVNTVAAWGDRACAASGGGLAVIDMSVPTAPLVKGTLSSVTYARRLAMTHDLAYVARSYSGPFLTVDISDPGSPTVVSTLPISVLDVAVADDHVVVAGFSFVGMIDMSNPTSPKYADWLNIRANSVCTRGGYAYVGSWGPDLSIVDISDPQSIHVVGRLDVPGSVRDVAVAGEHVYLALDERGLLVVDVSDPTEPTVVGTTHTQGLAYDVAAAGDFVYVSDWLEEPGLLVYVQVVDVSDPTAPRLAGRLETPGYIRDLALADDYFLVAGAATDIQFGWRQCGAADVSRVTDGSEPDEGLDPAVPDADVRITPNPFNPLTNVSFTTARAELVRIAVYDLRGRLVAQLADEPFGAGEHAVRWQGRDTAGRDVPSGVYLFRVDVGGRVVTRKAMLLR